MESSDEEAMESSDEEASEDKAPDAEEEAIEEEEDQLGNPEVSEEDVKASYFQSVDHVGLCHLNEACRDFMTECLCQIISAPYGKEYDCRIWKHKGFLEAVKETRILKGNAWIPSGLPTTTSEVADWNEQSFEFSSAQLLKKPTKREGSAKLSTTGKES